MNNLNGDTSLQSYGQCICCVAATNYLILQIEKKRVGMRTL